MVGHWVVKPWTATPWTWEGRVNASGAPFLTTSSACGHDGSGLAGSMHENRTCTGCPSIQQ